MTLIKVKAHIYDHLNKVRKSTSQNPTPICDTITQHTRNKRAFPQPEKGHV